MIVRELLSDDLSQVSDAQPDSNPLSEEDALQEAQILEILFDTARSTVGVLFDLRTALQLRDGNTGVLVARNVTSLVWSAKSRRTNRTAWNVTQSLPGRDGLHFTLEVRMFPDASLTIVAQQACFFTGTVPGLGEVPPDYYDDDSTIVGKLAQWESSFLPLQAAFINP